MAGAGVDLQARFAEAMGQLLGPDFPEDIGLAVSGGSDSMAMLTLAHNWTREFGVRLWVVSVDHGLRPESRAEAELVARTCAELGHTHSILEWQGWDGKGNLQDAARDARLRLIDGWRGRVRHVLMAHTADDQAETFLMRLARGSGVDGLAGMAARRFVPRSETAEETGVGAAPPAALWSDEGFWVIRPLLSMRREDLRHYLKVLKGDWVEDPSNDDPRFDRVRMRQAMEQLEVLGLGVDRLSETAVRMARAQEALRRRAVDVAQEALRQEHGDILLSRDVLGKVEVETRLRLMAGALQYISGADYRPRLRALEEVTERVLSGGTATLHGCLIRAEKHDLRICREYGAVRDATAETGALWDGRIRITGEGIGGLLVRALGESGAAQLPQRPENWPFQSLIAHPAVFDGSRLVAFPPAGFGPDAQVDYNAGQGSLHSFLLSH
ncbi:tRNA lysidine(34) synthetase TilS [Primorskyibacter aestuariivivens]|uniref:tRNA lysidine(34) synthetase TilS n=1 Tax=Primorskyibacter aestuariivivens TaxID=1888912 RepID=UPI00230052FD|nr:tRNA lysidine(34) synthetase TilS [Primorskyibacter aestuariivivens]MDA7428423.1 tRNA lysidine(34) synthetase TilS [Primorskyibacter aestuariivivens]